MNYLRMILICACVSVCMAPRAEAHKVNIFAYVDGNVIHTSSGYSKSRRVQSGTVEVRDSATGKVLLTGTTDTQGHFSFPVPEQARSGHMDLDLVILAGQGHRGVWKMPYEEYNSSSNVENSTGKLVENTNADGVETTVGSGDNDVAVSRGELEDVIRQVVREEVGGIRVMIADMRNEDPGLPEVLAGIGYLFGIAGLIAWVRSRRPRS